MSDDKSPIGKGRQIHLNQDKSSIISNAVDLNFKSKVPQHDLKSPAYIKYHFRHYPERTKELAIQYLLEGDQNALEGIVKDVLVKYSAIEDLNVDELNEKSEIVKDFGVDSLGVMEIACFLEETFSIRIENEKVMDVTTLEDVLRMTKQTIAEQEGVSWPKVTLGTPLPGDPPMAFKEYEIGWVPNPKNTTAALECTVPNKEKQPFKDQNIPVIDMTDPKTAKRLAEASESGELTEENYQEFIKKEFTPKKKKRKYTKKSEYWKNGKK
jgi:acyl carrier protein|tara:strand:+ start:3606 stop:4409 length:804 start_codon:yes stop_codon:yes gene_type:complete